MEVEGKIKLIGETKTFGSNGFRKRELVITTEEQYPQHILVEFIQEKCDVLDNYQVGQEVKININIRGREWVNPEGETKYFNSIQGWKIQGEQQPVQNSTSQSATDMPVKNLDAVTDLPAEDPNDLPF